MPYDIFQRTFNDILNDNAIAIPEHQRPYVWELKRAGEFITTVVNNRPTQLIAFYDEIVDGTLKRWLEDGQQRFLTLKKFIAGDIDWYTREGTRKYDELSREEQMNILMYKFGVIRFENMAREERIISFQNLQNGKPLTNGQRFNAWRGVSPLVNLAFRILNNQDCINILGPQNLERDKSKNIVTNAVAFAAGLALSDDSLMTNSYDMLGPEFLSPINEDLANSRLNVLLSVFRDANDNFTVKQRRKWWTVSTYIGFVLYAIRQPNFAAIRNKIVQHITKITRSQDEFKRFKNACPELHLCVARWRMGLAYIEDPENAVIYSDVESDEE